MAKIRRQQFGDPDRNVAPVSVRKTGFAAKLLRRDGNLVYDGTITNENPTGLVTDRKGVNCCCGLECNDCCGGRSTYLPAACCYSDKDRILGFFFYGREADSDRDTNSNKYKEFTITQSADSSRNSVCEFVIPCDISITYYRVVQGEVRDNCTASQSAETMTTSPPPFNSDWCMPSACDYCEFGTNTPGNAAVAFYPARRNTGILDCASWQGRNGVCQNQNADCYTNGGNCLTYEFNRNTLDPGSCFETPVDLEASSCRLVDREHFTSCDDGTNTEERHYIWFMACESRAACNYTGSRCACG